MTARLRLRDCERSVANISEGNVSQDLDIHDQHRDQ
jgi:hypothetical protein